MRETMEESGYKLYRQLTRPGAFAVLEAPDGQLEVWYANDDHAGYTIQIGRWGYEFGHDYEPE